MRKVVLYLILNVDHTPMFTVDRKGCPVLACYRRKADAFTAGARLGGAMIQERAIYVAKNAHDASLASYPVKRIRQKRAKAARRAA